ncbi:hypothetical protein LSH36_203g00031 [Paralvinella palmiformis]|uniref:thiopurine S-methyltransferase n=1 Tax=Paralvinella palmiformis TaxID=53620 RepID=A0AAD9JP70_9ANNE|nr:hypothetical protein LSH36_203g00031 [Paralvinella palmiformis]
MKRYYMFCLFQSFLESHLDVLVDGRQNIKIFFPLCGKTVDMKWLYDLGHTIVGVEGAQKPVEEFFKENDIEYTVHVVNDVNGHLYQSLDKRISLYLCDIYDFNSLVEGQFDAIWDRGSFGAINKSERARYAALLLSMMAPGCRYLLDNFSYDETHYIGPPRNVTEKDMQELFGSMCDIKLLDTFDMLTPERAVLHGLNKFDEQLWLLLPKC